MVIRGNTDVKLLVNEGSSPLILEELRLVKQELVMLVKIKLVSSVNMVKPFLSRHGLI